MDAKLVYAIAYVADMDKAVAFYRDDLGQTLRFASPFWSEFATGDVTLALHPASPEKPAGHVELGFRVPDVRGLSEAPGALQFSKPVREQHGTLLSAIRGPDGADISLST